MIKTKQELIDCLKYEMNLYFPKGKGYHKQQLVHSKNYVIYKYIVLLRHEEYYFNSNSRKVFFKFILYFYYKRRKNILGQKIGFDIPKNCFEKGLLISHVGSVIINANAKIGRDCTITGNVCIGVGSNGTPVIGDNCVCGFGSSVIGNVKIGDNCIIGAGAVVTKSFSSGCHLVGIPAHRL